MGTTDPISEKGYVSRFHHGLVHEPITVKDAMTIPDATAAVDKEWEKLMGLPGWEFKNVKPRSESGSTGEEGRADLFVSDPSRTSAIQHTPILRNISLVRKGESCSGGDTVKDDGGYKAVFTEQAASALQLAAARFLDAISRLLGLAGEANDAVSPYKVVDLCEAPGLLRLPENECPQVWMRLPPSRRPKHWHSIEEPVVRRERNLYGHPLAGLL